MVIIGNFNRDIADDWRQDRPHLMEHIITRFNGKSVAKEFIAYLRPDSPPVREITDVIEAIGTINVAKDRNGSHVLQYLIEHDACNEAIAFTIAVTAAELCTHPFGSYVAKTFYIHGAPADMGHLLTPEQQQASQQRRLSYDTFSTILINNMVPLSGHWIGSQVLQTVVAYGLASRYVDTDERVVVPIFQDQLHFHYQFYQDVVARIRHLSISVRQRERAENVVAAIDDHMKGLWGSGAFVYGRGMYEVSV